MLVYLSVLRLGGYRVWHCGVLLPLFIVPSSLAQSFASCLTRAAREALREGHQGMYEDIRNRMSLFVPLLTSVMGRVACIRHRNVAQKAATRHSGMLWTWAVLNGCGND